MWPNPQFSADLVTLTEEILTGKFHFLCSVYQISLSDYPKYFAQDCSDSIITKQPQEKFYEKQVFSKISQNSQKVSVHKRFPVNFMKFLTTPFLQNTPGRLLLYRGEKIKCKPEKG